ncbi:protein charlatan-like isoform X2 [Neocloeon triangulifer]|uniref:protein charlatan-like isoform X2 n=1 Tax=Neocloeon triangulifer TaxID=2078957 RepID=UPI00286F98B0|nr:protein charlatan-like isoform X2 [Neocloeon triangulifer]
MDSGALPMDCYEDMFKEITRKLYGTSEDGLNASSAAPNAVANTPPTTTASNMENRGANNRYEEQALAPPFLKEETLTAFGLAALMQTSFPPAVAAMSNYNPSTTGQNNHYQQQSTPIHSQLPINVPPVPQAAEPVAAHVDRYVSSDDELSWTRSKIATYNPAQRTFKCSECDFEGFLARVAEHWIGTHGNLSVYRCPQCSYTSAWARCVRMHVVKQHSEGAGNSSEIKTEPDEEHYNAATNNPSTSPIPSSLWKEKEVLEEVTEYLQRLKTKAESLTKKPPAEQYANSSNGQTHRERGSSLSSSTEKRYSCSYCPYATDRRDLFTRHENIHKDEKPFHCYVCRKQFNRADHVKKHFLRMHRDHPYDINKIRRSPPKNASGMSYYHKYSAGQPSSSTGRSHQQQQPQVQQHQQVQQSSHFQQGQSHHNMHHLQPPQHHLLQTPHYTLPIRTPQPKAYLPKQQQQQQPQHQQNGIANKKQKTSIAGGSNSSTSNGTPPKEQKEKRFTCCYCSWSGVDNWCLKRHLNTHLKPFVCALCDYKAARSERLATHVLKVHNKRSCNKCHFLADDQLSLNEHMHEHHKPKEKVIPTPTAPWNTVPIPIDQTLC